MTERELFKALHGSARNLLHWRDLGDELNHAQSMECAESILIEALELGVCEGRVLAVVNRLVVAFENRKAQLLEPSRHSVYIQMLVHTHGRVRREA